MSGVTPIIALRAALAPLGVDTQQRCRAPCVVADETALMRTIAMQGLAPLWSHLVESGQVSLADDQRQALNASERSAAALYLLQRRAAARASRSLGAAGVAHAVFKGVALRERLYPVPALRPADDVDLLVTPRDRATALRTLVQQQFGFMGTRTNISHEVNLRDRYATIDLHWALFRPGRSRFELTPVLLETARPFGPLSVLSDDANLLVMLVHPAFTKHVNGRTGKLIRAVDLDRMLRAIQPDWGWILPLIDSAGLSTAAWAVLHWQRLLMDTPVDPAVLRHLEPGRLKRRYLAYWIDHQLPARLEAIPGLVQGAFTLALHERPSDALSATVQLLKARLESRRTLRHLQRLSQIPD